MINIRRFLITPLTQKSKVDSKFSLAFWLTLSLTFAIGYISLGLHQAFSHEYVIGDNAREYLPWMYRYWNPKLFPGDLIADYFQSVTPIGYDAFYRVMMSLGIDPIFLGKIFPMVINIVTTIYCFAVCIQLLPVPMAGFISTLLLNQALCLHDDLFSATPRDFVYPLFLAFIYYLLRNSLLGVLISMALLGLFYPPLVFIDLGILCVRLWYRQRRDYIFCGAGFAVAFLTILPYAIKSSKFAPTITAAMARTMPEYLAGGRIGYYNINPVNLWLDGRDSGFFALLNPPQLFIGFLFPILLIYAAKFPLVKRVNRAVILLEIVIASSVMFFIAHAIAFKIHFPSRYTHHTFKMVLALTAAMTLVILLDKGLSSFEDNFRRQFLVLGTTVFVSTGLILYPVTLKVFPKTPYVVGGVPGLYQYLQNQPEDSLVASLAPEADNIPPFAKRSTLVGKEYALPFHITYYTQFRQRVIDLINAQYSEDIKQAIAFIHKYNVKFWLLDRTAFNPEYIASNTWIQQYQPFADKALAELKKGITPALAKVTKSCTVFENKNLVLLKAECLE